MHWCCKLEQLTLFFSSQWSSQHQRTNWCRSSKSTTWGTCLLLNLLVCVRFPQGSPPQSWHSVPHPVLSRVHSSGSSCMWHLLAFQNSSHLPLGQPCPVSCYSSSEHDSVNICHRTSAELGTEGDFLPLSLIPWKSFGGLGGRCLGGWEHQALAWHWVQYNSPHCEP